MESNGLHQVADDTKVLKLQASDFRKLPAPDPAKVAERERLAKEREASYQTAAIAERRRLANIPTRLARSIEAAMQTSEAHGWQKKLSLIVGKLGTGFLFGLIGTYGVGKSQLGSVLVHRACESMTSLYIHAPDLFDTVKDVFRSDDGDTVREQLKRFIAPKLLVIDEVNQGLSEADIRYLHRVVCQRYDDMSDTLLISNESKADFQKLVGDRVVSRMIETGGIMEADWSSFRR